MSTTVTISTDQVRRTGNIADIAIVERLDRIIQLLEAAARPMVVTVAPRKATGDGAA